MIAPARRRIVFTSAAEQDVADAALWYDEHRPGLGEHFLRAIESAASAAADAPAQYPYVHATLRRILVHRFPYALVFHESQDELIVASCYHLHRDPTVWQSRG